jgi:DNA-binding SARP family transcriptional activator/tetratricopeptide (TPR) repeat protein
MKVRVLGPLSFERDDDVIGGQALGGARERRLLGVLAAHRGRAVPKDEIVECLWDRPPKNPAAAVDTAVSLLRRAMGSGATAVETRRPGYLLACRTDLDDLDEAEATGRLDEALDLVEGEFLEGEPPVQWVDDQRRALAQRRLDLLVRAGEAAADRGDDGLACERFRRALVVDVLREDAHRGLLASLARLGRRAEALRAFEHCRRVLREELGVDPAPETVALYERVLVDQVPEVVSPSSASDLDELPFLGRRVELAALCTSPPGKRIRLVTGEPGIGKTRLVAEAVATRSAQMVHTTKCSPLVAPVPFSVLRALAPELDDSDLHPPVTTRTSPEGESVRIAALWTAQLPDKPVVFVIDDLQWADEPSLVVLAMLLQRHRGDVEVLTTARDADLAGGSPAAKFVEWATSRSMLDRTVLSPLEPEELMAAGMDFAVWEATGGHPLLLTEHLRGGSTGDLGVLVLERAAGLGPAAVDVLRAVAVLGRPAPLDDVAGLARVDIPQARDLAAALAHTALLVERGGSWTTRHDVFADVVREELTDDARRAWHGRALDLLAPRPGVSASELAHHALAAARDGDGVRHSVDAGEQALAAYANREAAQHFERAVDLIDGGVEADATSLRRALVGMARALTVLGETDAARPYIERIPVGDGADEVERLLLDARREWAAWKPSRAIPPARRALDLASTLGDDELLDQVHAFIANPYGSLGDFEPARRHIEAAIVIADRLGRPPPAIVLNRLGLIQHMTGQELEALSTLDRCRELALAEHDERTLVFERIVRAWSLGGLGRFGEALSALDDVGTIGRGEEAVARARVPNTRASLLSDLGLVDMALDADEESLEIARASGGSAVAEPQIHTLVNLATDHLRLGDPDKASRCLEEAEKLAVDAEYARFRYSNRMCWVNGLLLLEGGDVEGALDAAGETLEMAERYEAPKYVVRARLLRGEALARQRRGADAAARELQGAVRVAESHGFAALAEHGHRLLASTTGSSHHARRADAWRASIVESVDGPLRARLR